MAEQNRWLGDPVALVLARREARWPLWAMMALGLYLTSVPFSYGWADESLLFCQLLAGITAFGVALFARLYPPLSYVAFLNAFVGIGLYAMTVLAASPGPIWGGPALIALALVIPASVALPGPDTPPGWFYNPSTWVQRVPVAALAGVGAVAARGCRPVAATFILALAAGLLGDRRRWRTAPWALCLSLKAAGTACFASALWLAAAPSPHSLAALLAALLMVVLSGDEAVATRLFLRNAPQLGQRFWDAFWNGGLLPGDPFAPRPSRRPAWSPPQSMRRRHSRRRSPGIRSQRFTLE